MLSHYPRILFKKDGNETRELRVNDESAMAAAVAQGWEARALPSLEQLEASRVVRAVYPRILFKDEGGGVVLEARAENPEQRAALEVQGYAIRPLPGEVIEPAESDEAPKKRRQKD